MGRSILSTGYSATPFGCGQTVLPLSRVLVAIWAKVPSSVGTWTMHVWPEHFGIGGRE